MHDWFSRLFNFTAFKMNYTVTCVLTFLGTFPAIKPLLKIIYNIFIDCVNIITFMARCLFFVVLECYIFFLNHYLYFFIYIYIYELMY